MPVLHDADIQRGLGRSVTLASVTTAAGAVSTSATAYTIQQPFTLAQFTLNVTAAATDVGDTLDVYLDTTFDGGTNWINIIHFTQLLGNGGAKEETSAINPSGNVATAPINTAADAAAGAIRHLLGDQVRVRYVQVDGDSDGTFTFTVQMRLF